jgi:hypothetical protein
VIRLIGVGRWCDSVGRRLRTGRKFRAASDSRSSRGSGGTGGGGLALRLSGDVGGGGELERRRRGEGGTVVC